MTTAIVITWTIGLLGALPATVVIVKESLLLIRTLRDTLRMAKLTAAASRGIGANVAAVFRAKKIFEEDTKRKWQVLGRDTCLIESVKAVDFVFFAANLQFRL